MKSVTLVVPGPIVSRTGGSIYDRRVAEGLRKRGWAVSVVELEPFAHPLAPPLHSAAAQFAAIPDHELVLVDGLAFGTMPEIVDGESWRLRFVPIVHMALWTTPGLVRGEAAWLNNLERRALANARHVVITGARSRAHVRTLLGRSDDSLITRIPPGVDPVATASRPPADRGPIRLLCVANLTWGKGYDILLRALDGLADRQWTLTCVGSAERDPQYAARLRGHAKALGLESRIEWAGELPPDATDGSPLRDQFHRADLFVLATRSETYGMAVAEAIAHGLPVVSTRTGEIPSIVGEGALLADAGDAAGFATALHEAVTNDARRGRLAAGARAAASRLPTWEDAAAAFEELLKGVDTSV